MSETIIPENDPVLEDFSPLVLSSGTVIRYQDGEVIYSRPDGVTEILREAGSLCGVGLFETGIDDTFIDCCGWHDHAYESRKFFEEKGWDRAGIDDYFLDLMLYVADQQLDAAYRLRCILKAHEYHFLVQSFGGLVYYRHPAGENLPPPGAAGWTIKRRIESCMTELFQEENDDHWILSYFTYLQASRGFK